MNKSYLPMSLSSSTKTMVGFAHADEPEAEHEPAWPTHSKTMVGFGDRAPIEEPDDELPSTKRAGKTRVGVGPSFVEGHRMRSEAVEAFLAKPAPQPNLPHAHRASAIQPSRKLTLVGMAPEEKEKADVQEAEPLSFGPPSYEPGVLAPASGPMLDASTRLSAPTAADLPFERPMLAVIGVSAAVAVWALLMLVMFF